MKKIFISLAVALLSVCANAQVVNVVPNNVKLNVKAVSATVAKVKKATSKVELASNQRIVGVSTTENIDNEVGLNSFPGKLKAASIVPEILTNAYAGAKVVGIKYAISKEGLVSRVFINAVTDDNENGTEVVSHAVSNDAAGWNYIALPEDKQYVLAANTELMIGFDYTQAATGDNAVKFPLCTVKDDYGIPLFIYANIPAAQQGHGEDWYNFGTSYGSLCVQLVVENDNFSENAVMPFDFSPFTIALNEIREIPVKFLNIGSRIESLSYTITLGDVTGAEQTYTLPTPFAESGKMTTLNIPFNSGEAIGTFPIKLNVTKVNGVTNGAAKTEANSQIIVISKKLTRRVVMEENTGTGCGWCPRGITALENLNNQYPDNFIGIAIHQYNRTDPMYNTNYAGLNFSGAPSCRINRGEIVDPYYGSGNSITDDIKSELAVLPSIGVDVTGYWNADITAVDVTANIESLVSGQYEIAYALVADGLAGTTNSWRQANYYNSAYGNQTGITSESMLENDLKKYYTTPSLFLTEFNDVMISSSYNGTVNQAKVDAFTEGGTTKANYSIPMPTSTVIKNALKYDKVYVVAMVINTTTGRIENAAKAQVIFNPTGISSVENNDNGVELARYNMSGQRISSDSKGINIIKMSNGKTVKQLVR